MHHIKQEKQSPVQDVETGSGKDVSKTRAQASDSPRDKHPVSDNEKHSGSSETTSTEAHRGDKRRHLICLRDLSNYRSISVSEPVEALTKQQLSQSGLPALSPVPATTPVARTPGTPAEVQGGDGTNPSRSPHESSMNGDTASPPYLTADESSDGQTGSSTSRQLGKLKRFLATLQQLGYDISTEIGEQVRGLVIALVSNTVGIEEFHDELQKTTNFPLRPFVIPFLKANLPLLQQELQDIASTSRLSPRQFLAHNHHILTFDANTGETSPVGSSHDVTSRPTVNKDLNKELNENGKRTCATERPKENGKKSPNGIVSPSPKRLRTRSPSDTADLLIPGFRDPFSFFYGRADPLRLSDMGATRQVREQLERDQIQRERDRILGMYGFHRPDIFADRLDRHEDDWKHVDNILQCIVGMVDKCQRALFGLQERSLRNRQDLAGRVRRTVDGLSSTNGVDIKRCASNLVSTSFHQTEEQRLDMIRRAEEAIKEVKRQAVTELQKAVAAAEAKASEILAVDRANMERTVEEVRKRTCDEVTALLNRQEDSSETCWNCGRVASETCSGCHEARYCGAFCQHRHWESHHRVCGKTPATAPVTIGSTVTVSSTLKTIARRTNYRVTTPATTVAQGSDVATVIGGEAAASSRLATNGDAGRPSSQSPVATSSVLSLIKEEVAN